MSMLTDEYYVYYDDKVTGYYYVFDDGKIDYYPANNIPAEINKQLEELGLGKEIKDGKPFKTRDGGVMRLEELVGDINDKMYAKIVENHNMEESEAKEIAKKVGLAALKYGDLSNQASKDYVFDVERFISFEGNTGPYILYTDVRIKSILNKYEESGQQVKACALHAPESASEKALMLEVAKFNYVMTSAYDELAPHKICAYIYDLSNAFNRFYHETKILAEEDAKRQAGFIALLALVKRVLEDCIDVLGFEAPERM